MIPWSRDTDPLDQGDGASPLQPPNSRRLRKSRQNASRTSTVASFGPIPFRRSGLVATALFDGATNGPRFRTYVNETLVPTPRPGDTVILDNLASHKVAGVREAVEAAGARLLYLPPYNPDFNPIERAFAKLKALLRSIEARTVAELWTAIRDALQAFLPEECRNYLTAAGYDAYDPT